MSKPFHFAEIFYSLQGEGHRSGTPTVFARFAGCNLQCNQLENGFDCDTDFSRQLSLEDVDLVHRACEKVDVGDSRRVIFTGGEPGLQLTEELVEYLHVKGWHISVETNGMYRLPRGIDWISCSPKPGIPEEKIVVEDVDEVRLVIGRQSLPSLRTRIPKADHLFVSPAFLANGEIDRVALRQCITFVRTRTDWRLSVQQHKTWGVR